jgi:cystathionine beta-lyase/cystathionine gamma-synthase
MSGFGGTLAIVLEGGGVAADTFTSALELALVAPSLGGVETLVSQPRHTSHIHFSEVMRAGIGIPDGFVRISVGLEDAEDLKEDFARALDGLR